jgi:hypothetical protein
VATKTLQVNITGDSSGAKRALDDTAAAAENTESKMSALSSKLSSVGKSMTLGVTLPVVGAGVVVGKWASDAAENANKVSVVFGENAAVINNWAKDAETSFGLSEGQAAGFFGSVGTMLKGFQIDGAAIPEMSKSILTLGSDLGSFHNLDTATVMDMISASFRGEYDSIQQLIPTINAAAVQQKALTMTGKANADQLTEQEKALATYQLLLEGAGPAAGDFARTQDGAANSMKIATAQVRSAGEQIGQVFLPIVAKVAGAIAGWADSFANLDDRTKTIIVVVAGAAAALGPLIWGVGKVISVVQGLSAAMGFLAANPIVLVIAAVVAIGAALVVAYQKVDWFRNAVDAAWDGIQRAIQWAWEKVIQPVFDKWEIAISVLLGPLGLLVAVVVHNWDKIAGAVQWAWESVIKPIWDATYAYVEQVLIPLWQKIWEIAQVVWSGIAAAVEWAWNTVIKPTWDALYSFIVTYLIPYYQLLWEIAKTVWSGIAIAVAWAWENVIRPAWEALKGFITQYLIPYLQQLWSIAVAVWNGVSAAVRFAWDNVIRPAFDNIKSGVRTVIDVFSTIKNGISTAFSTVYDLITAPFRTAFDAIKRFWNNSIGGKGFDLPSWVPFVGGKSFRFPTFHQGGWVPGPVGAEVPAILEAGEYVVSRDAINSTSIGRAGGAGGVTVIVNVAGNIATEGQFIENVRSAFINAARTTPGVYLPGVN